MSVCLKEVQTEWEAASAKRRSAASPLICGVLASPPPEVWGISSLYERIMRSQSSIPTLFSDGLYSVLLQQQAVPHWIFLDKLDCER